MKIYVGNQPFEAREEELRELFSRHGAVGTVTVVVDPQRLRSRGFGFVEMENQGEARTAIGALHGTELGGRSLTVNEAKPQDRGGFGDRRGPRGGGGFDRGGRGSERSSGPSSGGFRPRY
jgi:cold-inducible RNA-binding protein